MLVSDNGPQLFSEEFRQFKEKCNFTHVTSSPHYAQADRVVQIAKGILRQENPLLAMMIDSATQSSCSQSCRAADGSEDLDHFTYPVRELRTKLARQGPNQANICSHQAEAFSPLQGVFLC